MFALVRTLQGRVCKTVGYAFPGSNPGPATTTRNSPWPAYLQSAACLAASRGFPIAPGDWRLSRNHGEQTRCCPRPGARRRCGCSRAAHDRRYIRHSTKQDSGGAVRSTATHNPGGEIIYILEGSLEYQGRESDPPRDKSNFAVAARILNAWGGLRPRRGGLKS